MRDRHVKALEEVLAATGAWQGERGWWPRMCESWGWPLDNLPAVPLADLQAVEMTLAPFLGGVPRDERRFWPMPRTFAPGEAQ